MPPYLIDEKILRFALEQGILDIPKISDAIQMKEREKYLEKHTYSVWQNKSGKWLTYLPADNKYKRMLYTRNTEEEIQDVIIEYYKNEEENPTIAEVFEEYTTRREKMGKVSKATCGRERERFQKYFSEIKNHRIKSLKPIDITDFLEEQISKHHLTAKEFSNLKGITKGFLKRAKKRGLINFNVNELMTELDVSDSEFKKIVVEDDKEVYYDEEMEKILSYIKDNIKPVNLGIALMFASGIRIGELATLKREDFSGQSFKVKRTETRYYNNSTGRYVYEVKEFPKTEAGIRTVIVPDNLMWIINEAMKLNPGAEYMFNEWNNKRIRTFTFRKQVSRLCKRLNIPYRSPHKIRKTYCSILLDNGVDHKMIEKQVGHVDISITEGYYHRDRKHIQDKIDILNHIPQFKS